MKSHAKKNAKVRRRNGAGKVRCPACGAWGRPGMSLPPPRTGDGREPFCERLAEVIADRLHASPLTDYKIEQETGLSRQSIGDWRKGKYQPRFSSCLPLCRFFRMSMTQLTAETERLCRCAAG